MQAEVQQFVSSFEKTSFFSFMDTPTRAGNWFSRLVPKGTLCIRWFFHRETAPDLSSPP
jgi:hypothetical protein